MKKKIVINGRFLTRPLSGVQRTALELVKALDDLVERGSIAGNDFDFTILYSGKMINPVKLKHIKLLERGYLKGNLWEQFELPFYAIGSMLISMCSISTLFKRNQIVIVHDVSFKVNKAFFSLSFRLWYGFAIPMLGKICKQIVTVSEFSKSELIKHAGINGNKIEVIYNAAGHILEYNDPGDDFITKINSFKPYCLAVSNLAANKNYAGLHSALSKINFQKYKMVIAGGVMDTLASSEQNSSANYLGYVTDNELKYLYQNASLFIFPSFYEGFGIPPLEAMTLGCPVIASNTSSIPEILNNSCEYFDPNDVDDMARKIDGLINDEKQMELLKIRGLKQVTKYSWGKSAKQLVNLMSMHHV